MLEKGRSCEWDPRTGKEFASSVQLRVYLDPHGQFPSVVLHLAVAGPALSSMILQLLPARIRREQTSRTACCPEETHTTQETPVVDGG